MVNRADWLRALALARRGGRIRATLPNLVVAYHSLPPLDSGFDSVQSQPNGK